MTAGSQLTRRAAKQPAQRLDRDAWVGAAQRAFIAGGVAAVKVEPLAAALGVTTGSFYWHFADRPALLAALLDHWRATNTAGMEEAVRAAGADGERQFDAIITVWVEERGFSSAYDAAMRDWARIAPDVAVAVRAVDRRRIALLKRVFLNLGYDADRAEVRARIMYFHQVGYYALGVTDPERTKLRLRKYYVEALRDGPGRRSR